MSLKTISYLLLFLVSMNFALASSPYCYGNYTSKLLVENARPYEDLGQPYTFYIYYLTNNNSPILENATNNLDIYVGYGNQTLNLSINNATFYDSSKNRWFLTLNSSTIENTNITINAKSDIFACKSVSFITRWRIPFYVTFQLYKQPLNSTDPAMYSNDFQYVSLVDNHLKKGDDLTVYAFNKGVDNLFDNTIGLFVDTKSMGATSSIDRNVYFSGRYNNGIATVKLYEPSNYTVYVMNNKITYPINYFYEFERPTTNDVDFMGEVYSHLRVYDENNVSNTYNTFNNTNFKISFTKFEANTYYAYMNIFKMFLVAVVYFGILGLMCLALSNSPALGTFIVYYLLIATPIALSFIYYIN